MQRVLAVSALLIVILADYMLSPSGLVDFLKRVGTVDDLGGAGAGPVLLVQN